MRIKLFLTLMSVLLPVLIASAQQQQQTTTQNLSLESGVAPHKELDEVYRRFIEAYKKLDSEAVANLYAQDAFYLSPGADVKRGREKILRDFSGYFDSVRKEGGSLSVSFQILGRQVSVDLAYDVGIYTVAQKSSNGETRTARGKFVVVARRMKNGEWLFQVDGYSNLPNNSANNQKPPSQADANVSQADSQKARRALEAQHAKLAKAIKNKDFEAFQAFRTADFSTKPLNGEQQSSEEIAARAGLLLERIRSPIEVSFEILQY